VSTDGGSVIDTGADSSSTATEDPTAVLLATTLGDIVIELELDLAPVTTANFLAYVDAGFYDGTDGQGATIVHRVVPGFVIQGGGLTESLETKATMPPIINESDNGLSNVRGTVAMARTNDPDSATAQFFVNLLDNGSLDNPPGYAVFGEVVDGLDVVDAIAAVATAEMGGYEGVPVEPVVILSASAF
jgi:cyclophilin family peptidyl-prolyl cis-trans isomerase